MAIKIKIDLDADTQKLSDTIQRAVSKGFQGGGASGLATNPSSVAAAIMGRTPEGMRGYRDTMGATVLPSEHDFTGGRGNAFFWSKRIPPTIASIQARNQQQQAQFLKNIGTAGIPLLNPGSLFGNMLASRQIYSGLSGPVGQGLLGKIGIGGTAATAGATGVIMAGLLVVGASLKALAATIKSTMQAFEDARKLYAKSLLSGLGIQFTVQRKNFADVIGVSEKEVFQFGAAMGILGPKLKFASDIIAKTTPNLTSVAWEFGIVKKDLEALFFTLANDAAPTLRKFADEIGNLIKIFILGIQEIEKHPNLINFFKGLSGVNILDLLGGKDIGAAPSPQGMMKQLPASHLERMGLVVGGFGINNDAGQRTAKATERSAKLLEKIFTAVSGSGSVGFGDPFMNAP